ncbi:MAG: hypothetical protein ABR523_09220 [Desulfurivibrionaceae bacterium]
MSGPTALKYLIEEGEVEPGWKMRKAPGDDHQLGHGIAELVIR